MGTVASLQVVIGAKIDGLRKEIDSAQKILKQKFGSKGLGISQSSLEILGGLGVAIAGIGAAAVRSSAQMEQTRKAFTTLLQDASLAKDFLAELERFAASTPFELPGLLDASKRMLAFGFSAQQVIPILTAVGDSAAALGMGQEGINRLTMAIGQMQAKGKVSAEEMLQLAEAGVPAWQMLADAMGKSIPEAMKLAEKGAIDSATGIQAIVSGMNSKFGGMMKDQATTINGMLSNIKDSVGQTMTVVGDEITEGLDLKTALKTAQDDLSDFAAKVKSSGISEAIRDTVPPAVGATIAGFATVLTATAIPALAKLGITAAGTAAAFVGITGPVALAAAGIGASAYLIWQNWDWLVVQWDYFCITMQNSAIGAEAEVKNAFAGMVSDAAAGLNNLMSLVGASSDLANQAKEWADNVQKGAQATIEAAKANQQIADSNLVKLKFRYESENAPTDIVSDFKSADVNNLGLKSSIPAGAGAAGTSSGGVDKIAREIDRINEQLAEAKNKTIDLQRDYNNFSMDIQVSGLSEFDKVYAGIVKERDQRIAAVQEWQDKFANATTEAQQLYERAMKTGDANAIASAAAMLEQRKAMEADAASQAAQNRLIINQQMNDQLLSQETLMQAYKAELDELQKQGELERYMGYLTEEKAAFMQNQIEQQYYDWRLEAEQSYASFALEAANTLKDGLAQGFANAIVSGQNFGKTLQNLGKEIVKMFLQWQVQRIAAAALSKAMMSKETASVAAQGAAMAEALAPAAWAKLVVEPGAAGVATGLLTAGLSGAAGIGAASGAVTSLGGGASSMSFGSGGQGIDFGYKEAPFAAGGIVTGPVHALIGEKSYPEAVIPLRSSVLESIAGYMFGGTEVAVAGNTQVTASMNIYGDINTGSDEADLYDNFGSTILSAIRGRK
ncbi:tape measure protein [Phascolarctobacterium faecium]|uniref:tape measure protein n=1 Tax=Phascolarctobacterium faecium TaxID=33025 RepID=UPI002051BFA8|nr:MAG TPA: tail tape measure protein [Caudoviricetes sp.]